jgi:hypothetical protein
MRYLSSLSSEPRTSSCPVRHPATRSIPALACSPAYTGASILPQTAGLRVARSYHCPGLERGGRRNSRACLSSSGGHDAIDPPATSRVSRRPSTPFAPSGDAPRGRGTASRHLRRTAHLPSRKDTGTVWRAGARGCGEDTPAQYRRCGAGVQGWSALLGGLLESPILLYDCHGPSNPILGSNAFPQAGRLLPHRRVRHSATNGLSQTIDR